MSDAAQQASRASTGAPRGANPAARRTTDQYGGSMSDAAQQSMRVSFWGTRGSVSTPGRTTEKYGGNTPCVSVHQGDTHIVLDAGTGIRGLGAELARTYAKRPNELTIHLFLSHTHWDHIQGMPFFDPAYIKGVKLIIHGSPSKSGALASVLGGQMKFDYFPVDMSELAAEITVREIDAPELTIGPFRIAWQEQHYHPGGSVRYAVRSATQRVVYSTDIELDRMFEALKPTAQEQARREEYLAFINQADLLVADGQYTPDEYTRAVGWGHTTIPLLCRVAHHAGVRQLAVFHHDPQHTDKTLDEFWKQYNPQYLAASPPMNVFWAREGITIPV